MDMLHFALQQEMQVEQYYRQLALISQSTPIKEVFLDMAEAEHAHVLALQAYQEFHDVSPASHEYVECRDWIRRLEADPPQETVEDAMQLYQAAREVKRQEEQFYEHAAEKTDIPLEKLLFKGLSKDEGRGAMLMDRLCCSVCREPIPEPASA